MKSHDAAATPPSRDRLWHIIARHIACEADCQKWPNGCGCAQNAADEIVSMRGVAQGSGSHDEIRNAALEEAALYHDRVAAACRAIAFCNPDNDLGADGETYAIDHEIAAKDIREMKQEKAGE